MFNFFGWFRKTGKWSELDKEERLRAKALIYGAAVHAEVGDDGFVHIEQETISKEKETNGDKD